MIRNPFKFGNDGYYPLPLKAYDKVVREAADFGNWMRHPVKAYRWYVFRVKLMPKVGEEVYYHDEGPFIVTVSGIDEDKDWLEWSNPGGATMGSWVNCCHTAASQAYWEKRNNGV